MIAQIKSVKVIPTKYDDEGIAEKDRFASVLVEIPMDCKENVEGVVEILECCDSEYVNVELEAYQKPLPGLGTVATTEANTV